jgi:hypothetical protein
MSVNNYLQILVLVVFIAGIITIINMQPSKYTGYVLGEDIIEEAQEEPTDPVRFAQCLTRAGNVFFITKDCPECEEQLEIFGNGRFYLDVVDCSKHMHVCREHGIYSAPAWILNEKRYGDIYTIFTLSALSGCGL